MIKTFLIYTLFDYCIDKLDSVIQDNLTRPALIRRIRDLTANTRKLRATYTLEVMKDMTVVGLIDLEAELLEALNNELRTEIFKN